MADNILKSQAFKLKGRGYTLTVLHLLNNDKTMFIEQLNETKAKAPKLFDNTPIVLDCTALENQSIDFDDFFYCLREHTIYPIAVQGVSLFQATLLQAKGIAVLNASSTNDKSLSDASEPPQTITPEPLFAKIHATPVRSGQQMVSKGGDLIITASVSHGAELLADGHIHVYGALRGRALAGISGNKQARIFCQSLEAELISIAGVYRLSDAILPCSEPCQIYLQNDLICIEPLN